MKSTSAALARTLAGPVTTLATCWRITGIDGREFFFTDHDRDLRLRCRCVQGELGCSRTAIAPSKWKRGKTDPPPGLSAPALDRRPESPISRSNRID
jgi:hypothetical protein